MRPLSHLALTLALGGLVYAFFRSLAAFLLFIAGGILLDIDHILDYYLQEGMTLKLKNIYVWFIEERYDRIFLYMHSLELLISFWFVILVLHLGPSWIALALGLTLHIILDIFFNKAYFFSYFFLFRLIKNFKKEALFKEP